MIQNFLNRYIFLISTLQERQMIRNFICQIKTSLIVEFHNGKQGTRRFEREARS